MTCELPPAQCLAWHVKGKITGAALSDDGRKLSAPCPAHRSLRQGTLSMTVGNRGQRIVWYCHRGCDELAVRAALTGLGIEPGCIPMSKTRQAGLIEQIGAILSDSGLDHAVKLLDIAAVTRGNRDRLPRGAELEQIARLAGVSRSTAYAAPRAIPLPPAQSVPVKSRYRGPMGSLPRRLVVSHEGKN